MKNKINAAIQVLPLDSGSDGIKIIDHAIEIIANSGLEFRVTPFETVVEGNYDEVIVLLKKVQQGCYRSGAEELIVNVKLHSRNGEDVSIHGKMEKYDPVR